MNITTLQRPASLVEGVCQQLAGLIRGGSADEERWLPAERSLAEQLGVSRTVVREATKRLEQQGMLEIQHGSPMRGDRCTQRYSLRKTLRGCPIHATRLSARASDETRAHSDGWLWRGT